MLRRAGFLIRHLSGFARLGRLDIRIPQPFLGLRSIPVQIRNFRGVAGELLILIRVLGFRAADALLHRRNRLRDIFMSGYATRA